MNRTMLSAVACLVGILLLMGAYRVALALYKPHSPLVTHLADRQAGMAAFVIAGNRMDLALELGRKATQTDPDSAVAHYTLAAINARENQQMEAMVEYREAIRRKPDWTDPRINLGILLGQTGRLEEAAEQFRAAGDHPDARYNLEITERALQDQKRRRRP
jgi:Tfp pilus assembly protein PilF